MAATPTDFTAPLAARTISAGITGPDAATIPGLRQGLSPTKGNGMSGEYDPNSMIYDSKAAALRQYANRATDIVERPLDRVSGASERVHRSAHLVEEFVERFNGPLPLSGGTAVKPPEAIGHHGSINRLFEAIDRLEIAIAALNKIG